jgi:ABC-type nitrate/sulfonate/bicarbonate transport system substrate-binding protein
MRITSFGSRVLACAVTVAVVASACASTEQSQPGPPRNGLPGPEKTSITIGISSDDPHQFALQLAIDEGIFSKYGIKATGKLLNGVQPTTQAMLSGQLDAATNNSTATIISLGTSRPLVDIGIVINRLPDVIYGGKGITDANGLRGKKIAISQLGGQSNTEAFIGMRQLGLNADEFHITQIGSQGARVSALQAGTVAATPADPGLKAKLAKSGITPVVDLRTADVQVPGSNIQVRRDFAEKYPNLTLIIMAAVIEAVQTEFTDTKTVAHYYADWAGISDDESMELWQDYLDAKLPQRDLRAYVPGYNLAKEVLADFDPSIAYVDATKAYDGQFIDKLDQLGFLQKLGVPSSSTT